MTTLVIDLTKSQSDSPLPTSTPTTSTIITTTTLPPPPLQSTTDSILVRRIGELEQHIADLIQNNLALKERLDKHGSMLYKLENLNIPHQVSKVVDEIVIDAVDWAMQALLRARFRDLPTVDMKEILQQRMFEDNTYKTHEVHNDLYEALQKSVELDYSNQCLADQEEARKKKRKRRESPRTPPGSPPTQPPLPPPLVGDDSIPEEHVLLSDDEDSENDHQPKADLRKDWWKPLPEEERSATLKHAWTIPSSNKSDVVDWTNPEGDQVRINVNRPLPLGGPLGHVTIQLQFFFNKDMEYLRYGSKGSNPALSISKMKAASYLDFGLELLVLEQIHDSPSHRKDIRTHMRILSVVRIKAYSRYGDFKDLNLLLLQGHLDHLPSSDKWMISTAVKLWTRNLVIRQRVKDFQLGIESYQTPLNHTKPGWDATG
ncbi:hypothetical protein Tco_0286289 [Tanacetum coccineum]